MFDFSLRHLSFPLNEHTQDDNSVLIQWPSSSLPWGMPTDEGFISLAINRIALLYCHLNYQTFHYKISFVMHNIIHRPCTLQFEMDRLWYDEISWLVVTISCSILSILISFVNLLESSNLLLLSSIYQTVIEYFRGYCGKETKILPIVSTARVRAPALYITKRVHSTRSCKWWSLPVACPWSVVLFGYSGFFHH